jgi:DNA-directed RNA polymerase subunit H
MIRLPYQSTTMSSHLSTKYHQQVTWNGYPADVMKSGLQKYIRRGIIDKALYCAGELDLFKDAPNEGQGEGIRTNFLHRLMVIYMEDVENISLFDEVERKMDELFKEREKADRSKEKEERLISELVIRLGQSTKARMCSHVRAVFNPKYKPIHSMFPSIQVLWAEIEQNKSQQATQALEPLEFHCAMFKKYLKEKSVLSVYYAFQIEASEQKLKESLFRSSNPVFFIFQQLISPLFPAKSERVTKFVQWYKKHIGTMGEGFMCWLLPLLHELGAIPLGQPPVDDGAAYPMTWDRNRAGERMEIDKYVEDKHTSKGRARKAGLIEFAFEGALVENQADFVNPLWKQFYEDGKRLDSGVVPEGETVVQAMVPALVAQLPVPPVSSPRKGPKIAKKVDNDEKVDDLPERESTAYDFVVRTQLTTMGTKMDVYFAKDKGGKLVVVKGPYATRKEIDILVSNTEWKKKFNLPYNRFEVRQLMPDRWPQGVPLGARNKINRNQPAFFLVFESYIEESQLQTIQKSSPLWPPTETVDWEKIPFHIDYRTRALTEREMIDYVHALLFRYLLGISDYADRNFVLKDGHVISIDEDVENHDINLYRVLQKNKANFVYQWLKDNYEKLDVSQWEPKFPTQQVKLTQIQNKASCLQLFQEGGVEQTGINLTHKNPDESVAMSAIVKPARGPRIAKPKAAATAAVSALEAAAAQTEPLAQPVAAQAEPVAEQAEPVAEPAPEPVAQKEKTKPEITISKMNDSFVFIDNIYRSRMTLLDILEERGYQVDIYRKFSPAEATAAAAATTLAALNFIVSKKDDATKKCDVRYANVSRPKLETFFNDVSDDDSENTEVVVMMYGPVMDAHHVIALKQYTKLKEQQSERGEKIRRKLRVSFFCIDTLVVNPLKHVLVPKHEIVPEDKHKELMASMYITAKSKFPEIKFHLDPIARCIGAVPGDIIKITRPSASSGQTIIYRVCAP